MPIGAFCCVAGLGLSSAGFAKIIRANNISNSIKHRGGYKAKDKTITLPHREGAKFTRHAKIVNEYHAPVYVGDKIQVPIGGSIDRHIQTKSVNFSFLTYPELKLNNAACQIVPSELFLWKKTEKQYQGSEKILVQTGDAPEYHFYYDNDGTLQVVSDSKETIANTLGDPDWGYFAFVIGAVILLVGLFIWNEEDYNASMRRRAM